MLDTSIKIKTDFFDGPLSLLLMLIKKEELNIEDIDLSHITRKYLHYIIQLKELNFDIAGNYLYMAATLLLLKSSRCIEKDRNPDQNEIQIEEEIPIQSREELIQRLLALEHYQKMGQKINTLPKRGKDIFTRPKLNKKKILNSMLVSTDVKKLISSMINVLERQKGKFTIIKTDSISIKDKLKNLGSILSINQRLKFDKLLELDGGINLENSVITFISILELSRMKNVSLFQSSKEDLYINIIREPKNWNLDEAQDLFNNLEKEKLTENTPISIMQ